MSQSSNRTGGVTTDWVCCPVCGEPDMRRETNAEEMSLIFCVNHGCKSNGGTNASALAPALPTNQEAVPTTFVESVDLLVTISDLLVESHREVEEVEAEMQGSEGAVYFLQLGTRDKAAAYRSGFLRKQQIAIDLLRPTLEARKLARHKKAA